jgi:hypothetical protein
MGPQPIGIELHNLAQGVEAGAVGVAGEIVKFLELAEDGDIDLSTESLFEFRESRRLSAEEKLA